MRAFCRFVLVFLILMFGVCGCAQKEFTYNKTYIFSEAKLRDRKVEAECGNAQAAFDIYLHFMLGLREPESPETVYWLKRAVALGHPAAKKHLKARRDNAPRSVR